MIKKLLILIALTINIFGLELTDFLNKEMCGEKNQIIDKEIYTICYDTKMKGPAFVGYELDGKLVHSGNFKKRPGFYTEKNLKKNVRTSNGDFVWSGTDKGHLANHANFDNEKDLKRVSKTYSLANISPQYPTVNRKLWLKAEMAERDHAKRLGSLNVMNLVRYDNKQDYLQRMPIEDAIKLDKKRKAKKNNFKEWDDKKIKTYHKKSASTLKKKIVIPTAYYKIMWNDVENFRKCYMYENDKYATSSGDKLKHHKIDCKELLSDFGLNRI
jgi:endonuclease G, mitochondrial